jgi:2-methylcitrate dehydratase PrpD
VARSPTGPLQASRLRGLGRAMPMLPADRSVTASRGVPDQPALAHLAAEQACAIAFHDIPADVVALAKTHLLDQLGIGLAAAALPRNRPLASLISAFGSGGNATALGFAGPAPAAAAVLRNGALMHSLEYDGTHTASVAHAGSVVAPVALAVCEETGASGARLLRAFVLGWEMFVRLGLAASGSFSRHGFQFTAVGGPFVAAMTAGLLLGYDQQQLTSALGIAGSQASGVMEFVHEGATVKALHAGWPAHAGLLAARLAEAGMTGPSTILEGAHGFYALYARDAEAPARLRSHLHTLGAHWHLRETALKVRASCHYIQPFLECLEILLRRGLKADDIAAIHCEVPCGEESLICEPWAEKLRPASAYQAKFSLPYALGALLVDGEITIATFEGPTRPDVCARARHVTWSPMADGDFPNRYGARLTATLGSNERLSAEVVDVRGTPGRPFAHSELPAKFYDCARRMLQGDAPERLAAAVDHLDGAADLAALTAALRCVR